MKKEKLVKLISRIQDCGCDFTDVVQMTYVDNNRLAEYLISQGVIVQGGKDTIEDTDIYKVPTINAAPLIRGQWIFNENLGYDCSHCGKNNSGFYCKSNYCPNCGAYMREEVCE
jgi:hypothetical protein